MRISDWSSDVCSSDLQHLPRTGVLGGAAGAGGPKGQDHQPDGQRYRRCTDGQSVERNPGVDSGAGETGAAAAGGNRHESGDTGNREARLAGGVRGLLQSFGFSQYAPERPSRREAALTSMARIGVGGETGGGGSKIGTAG